MKHIIPHAFTIVYIMMVVTSAIIWSPTVIKHDNALFPLHLVYYIVVECSDYLMIPPEYVFYWIMWIHVGLVALAVTMHIVCFFKKWDIAENTPREEPNKKDQ